MKYSGCVCMVVCYFKYLDRSRMHILNGLSHLNARKAEDSSFWSVRSWVALSYWTFSYSPEIWCEENENNKIYYENNGSCSFLSTAFLSWKKVSSPADCLVNLFLFSVQADKLLDLCLLCYNGTLLLLPLSPKTLFGLQRNNFLL